jgi:hypothetical protein
MEADMSVKILDDPYNEIEKTLIEEYLNEQGYSLEQLKKLPERVVKQLMKEATRYVVLRKSEIEAKAHLVDEIIGGSTRHN